MLVRGAARETSSTPRPYLPLGVTAVGLFVAYQAVTSFDRLSPTDVALLFLFVFALALFMGLRFFVVDKYDLSAGPEPGVTPGVEQTEAPDEAAARGDKERSA